MINKETLELIVQSFLHPEKGTESKEEPDRKQITLLAKEFKMTPSKIRKILITAGVFSNVESKQVQSLYDSGKTIQEIMEITGLGRSSVNSYLPYSKGAYKNESDVLSIGNLRVKKHREKKDASVAVMSEFDTKKLKKHVVFYGVNDLGTAFHLDAVRATLLKTCHICSLREAIHSYNCYLYIANNVFSREWSDTEKSAVTENAYLHKGEVARFLNDHPDSILNEFLDLEYDYQDCSMRMAAAFRTFKKWDRKKLKEALSDEMVRSILKVETLVNHLGEEITEYLCNSISLATEVLVDDNHIPLVEVNNRYYMPKQFTANKRAEVLRRYIYSENPRIEYLLNIIHMPHTIRIGENALADAERKIDEYRKNNLSVLKPEDGGMVLRVSFVPYEEWKSSIIQKPTSVFELKYPVEVINQHLDAEGIFYCLKNMFGLFDLQNTQISLSKRNKRFSLVDDLMCAKTKYGYNLQHHQQIQMQYMQMTLLLYYDYLNKRGIRLESILGDGFSKLLKERYAIEGFCYKLPSSDASFEEKCYSICSKVEGLFKRIYKIEINEVIDQYGLKRCPKVRFSSIDSFLPDKYLYMSNDAESKKTVASISALLFSEMNLFSIDRFQNQDEKAKNNFELLLQNNISMDEIHDWDKDAVEFLKKKSCILEIKNSLKLSKLVLPLKELWDNGYISTYKTPSDIRVLRSLVASGWLSRDSTLLSKPEQDFLSYLYGNSKYPDAIALRNAYGHDDMSGLSEDVHKINYMWFLFMIIVLEIKLLDELETVVTIKNCQKQNEL